MVAAGEHLSSSRPARRAKTRPAARIPLCVEPSTPFAEGPGPGRDWWEKALSEKWFSGPKRGNKQQNQGVGAKSRTTHLGPFGELLRATGPMAKANPYRLSTKYQDDETDLIYYGYLYYNPNTGRWPNRDPLGEKGFETALRTKRCFLCKTAELLEGPNLYAFVANDPLDYVDTDGRGKYKLPPPGPYKPPIPIEPPAPKPSWPKRLWKCAIAPVNAVTCTSCAGGLLGIEAICGGAAGGGWEGMGYSDFNSCVCDFYNDNWLLKQTCNSCFSLPIAGGIGTLFEKVVGWGN